MRFCASCSLSWLLSLAAADELAEFCDTKIFPSCDVGAPVGREAPGLWTTNASHLSAEASRSSRYFRAKKQYPQKKKTYEFLLPDALREAEPSIIALHAGHDASIAVGKGSRIQCVLELERLFEVRYFSISGIDQLSKYWLEALAVVRDRCDCDHGPCPNTFDYGLLVNFGSHLPIQLTRLPVLVQSVFRVREWRNVNHHEAHALLGYFASPFRSALVVSYDGGGNDGHFNAFVAKGFEVHRIARKPLDLGGSYHRLASFLPEVTGYPESTRHVCDRLEEDPADWLELNFHYPLRLFSTFAGKLMGYSGLAQPSPELGPWIRQYYKRWEHGLFEVPRLFLEKICESTEGQRVVAATIQHEFERIVHPIVGDFLSDLQGQGLNVEGIVLTGGCALNVVLNQLVRETLTEATSEHPDVTKPQDVYVPPAPSDSGLAVGAIWAVAPPTGPRQPLQYLGFGLWDLEDLEAEAQRRGAVKLSETDGTDYLAELLAGGPAWTDGGEGGPPRHAKPIVAVVRGRQEFGPRALGHRSLLAVPDSHEMRERLNRLKARQWYRPVAPMIAEEALEEVFGQRYASRTMEFAPRVREEVRARFPALAHFDGTARHQSVGRNDEPWVHALLLAVARWTGLAALINTSFNSKGKPIANTVEACLEMLDELEDLDFVLIEDYLFRAPAAAQTGDVRESSEASSVAEKVAAAHSADLQTSDLYL